MCPSIRELGGLGLAPEDQVIFDPGLVRGVDWGPVDHTHTILNRDFAHDPRPAIFCGIGSGGEARLERRKITAKGKPCASIMQLSPDLNVFKEDIIKAPDTKPSP